VKDKVAQCVCGLVFMSTVGLLWKFTNMYCTETCTVMCTCRSPWPSRLECDMPSSQSCGGSCDYDECTSLCVYVMCMYMQL